MVSSVNSDSPTDSKRKAADSLSLISLFEVDAFVAFSGNDLFPADVADYETAIDSLDVAF